MKISAYLRRFFLPLILIFSFLAGSSAGLFSRQYILSEDRKFSHYTRQIFLNEITSSTLNLHYTLAHPEDYGIRAASVSLGEVKEDNETACSILENYEQGIRNFSYDQLSEENQITFDTLLLYFHTLQESQNYPYMEEILSPSLGIQAQLPVLFAEYTFYDKQDIEDYLALLYQTDRYFQSIVEYEQERSRRGYFMNDTCLNGILTQCSEFIEHPESNYLIGTFEDKIKTANFLSKKERQDYIEQNQSAVLKHLIPAYQLLIKNLAQLQGTCQNEKGLFYFPNGKEYYVYLLKTEVGVYDSPDSIRQQLFAQLTEDYTEMGQLLSRKPTLVSDALHSSYKLESPESAVEELQEAFSTDFPVLNAEYQVKYVDDSLEDFLSPAFYLTPPVDTMSPNTIYINQANRTSDLELYTTLAHEGFPGHLYQTQYFHHSKPNLSRYLPNFSGYIEGWATYVEPYAYSYAKEDSDLTRFLWLNRSINLCLYSLIDLGTHYYGWSLENVQHYLLNFGITNEQIVGQIYQAILENPVNYMKYYLGYLNFKHLREEMQTLQGDSFQLKKFHEQILSIGPTQFPVLRKHLGLS